MTKKEIHQVLNNYAYPDVIISHDPLIVQDLTVQHDESAVPIVKRLTESIIEDNDLNEYIK